DARECVPDDVGLEAELSRITDVRIERPAAERIDGRGSPIRRRLDHFLRHGVRQPLFGFFHERAHAFTGNRAAYEHDLPVVPRDHPPARRGFVDRQLDNLAFGETHGWKLTEGRFAASRSSRSNAAPMAPARASGAIRPANGAISDSAWLRS